MHWTEYDTRLAAYAVIVDDEDRVLLALWNEASAPLWTMPGGGVDFGETAEDGAVREVREETGYDVELARILGIDTHVVPVEERTREVRPALPGHPGRVRGTGRRRRAAQRGRRDHQTRPGGSRSPRSPTCPGCPWSTSRSGWPGR